MYCLLIFKLSNNIISNSEYLQSVANNKNRITTAHIQIRISHPLVKLFFPLQVFSKYASKCEGDTTGLNEGIPLGTVDGLRDGCEEGNTTGWTEGSIVGRILSVRLELVDGCPVGLYIGVSVGWQDGCGNGGVFGLQLGCDEGSLIG